MTTTALIANNLPVPSALGSLDAYIAAVNRVPVLKLKGQAEQRPHSYRTLLRGLVERPGLGVVLSDAIERSTPK